MIINRSVLMPTKDLSPAQMTQIRKATEDFMVRKATELWGKHQEVTLRDLQAKDLGRVAWYPQTSPSSYAIARSTIIGIYGVLQLSAQPGAERMAIDIGGARVVDVGLEQCYGSLPFNEVLRKLTPEAEAEVMSRLKDRPYLEESFIHDMRGYFLSPIIISENVDIRIDFSPPNTDRLILLGYVTEKLGVRLSS